ncbi:LysR family transcriptional regulator [Alkalihalobacillus sp. BA299]|uniref:LysR family transcriptional regulator n=1 Tax=Alkalihalobacillus sp. BA299 TaxID=2815938 RepID=UPI001ADAEAA8|nr:LysR family transcriptional regulator [Alkalihalobacillus sp. BA299]
MNDKDWSILLTLNETSNITKAAEKLHISQPALSYRIQQIEEEFSIKIFTRGKKGLHLTKEGEYIVDYARSMTGYLRQLRDRLSEINNTVTGELRIGVSSNYALFKLPVILKDFMKLYPDVQIIVKTGWSNEILKSFLDEEIHIGIIRGNYDWNGPKVIIEEDPVCLISKDPINFSDLPNLPRIDYKTDPDLKFLIENWWKDWFSQPPLIIMEVDKLAACREMVLTGLGYGIIPRYMLNNNDNGLYIHDLKTPKNKAIFRKLSMFYRTNDLSLSVVKVFVDFIKERKHQ